MTGFVPALRTVHDGDDREHDWHLDEDANDRGQRSARVEAEETDGRSDRQFEEVTRANQGGGAGYAVLHSKLAIQQVSQTGVEDHLDEDWHREHRDDQGLVQDGFALDANSKTSVSSRAEMDKGPSLAATA